MTMDDFISCFYVNMQLKNWGVGVSGLKYVILLHKGGGGFVLITVDYGGGNAKK